MEKVCHVSYNLRHDEWNNYINWFYHFPTHFSQVTPDTDHSKFEVINYCTDATILGLDLMNALW